MFHNQTITEHKSILNIFKAHIEKTSIPSYIALPEDYNINQVNVCGVTGWFEDSVDENTNNIKTEWAIGTVSNPELEQKLHSFLSIHSEKSDALNDVVDCAIYLMDFLAKQTLQNFNDGNYLLALCYATAFEHQLDSVLETAGLVFADFEYAIYITGIIPQIISFCNKQYCTLTE